MVVFCYDLRLVVKNFDQIFFDLEDENNVIMVFNMFFNKYLEGVIIMLNMIYVIKKQLRRWNLWMFSDKSNNMIFQFGFFSVYLWKVKLSGVNFFKGIYFVEELQ